MDKDTKIELSNLKEADRYNVEYWPISRILIMNDIGGLNIPDLQREYESWRYEDVLRLIESIITGFPLPPIYLHLRKGKYEIIDGQHRILSIYLFVFFDKYYEKNKNKMDKFFNIKTLKSVDSYYLWNEIQDKLLENIEGSEETMDRISTFNWNQFTFNNFSTELKNKLLTTKMQVIITEGNESVSDEIFIYLNTTGEPLLSGEVIDAKYITACENQDKRKIWTKAKIFMELSPAIKKLQHRKSYILFGIIPFYVFSKCNDVEEKNKFLAQSSIEKVQAKWMRQQGKKDLMITSSNICIFFEWLSKNPKLKNILTTYPKKSEYYWISLSLMEIFFKKNKGVISLNESKIAIIDDYLSIVKVYSESVFPNRIIVKKFLSRVPSKILKSVNFINNFLKIKNDDRDDYLNSLTNHLLELGEEEVFTADAVEFFTDAFK